MLVYGVEIDRAAECSAISMPVSTACASSCHPRHADPMSARRAHACLPDQGLWVEQGACHPARAAGRHKRLRGPQERRGVSAEARRCAMEIIASDTPS